jgi:hypothetical protein
MPDFPFRTINSFDSIAYRLDLYCGISRELASKRLHNLKADYGLPGGQNVIFDLCGGVYVLIGTDLEYLGSLTAGGAQERA